MRRKRIRAPSNGNHMAKVVTCKRCKKPFLLFARPGDFDYTYHCMKCLGVMKEPQKKEPKSVQA